MGDWTKICCALDFSEPSSLSLIEAADLARRFQAELTLLHVFEEPAGTAAALEAPHLEHLRRAAGEAERKLAESRAAAEQRTGWAVLSAMRQGDPSAEILRFVADGGFDLLVVGTHGRKGIRHLLLGSVAERVLREATCPVLVVRKRG